MDLGLWIGLALVVAVMVAVIAWFGPRRDQWKTHDGHTTSQADPLDTLPDDSDHPDER